MQHLLLYKSTCYDTRVDNHTNDMALLIGVMIVIHECDWIENESVSFSKDVSLPGKVLVAQHRFSIRLLRLRFLLPSFRIL